MPEKWWWRISELQKVKVEHPIIFFLPLEKCVFSYCKQKIFNAALSMFSNLACIPTVATVPLRHNTPKTFLQSSKLSINSKVLILNSCKDILLHNMSQLLLTHTGLDTEINIKKNIFLHLLTFPSRSGRHLTLRALHIHWKSSHRDSSSIYSPSLQLM